MKFWRICTSQRWNQSWTRVINSSLGHFMILRRLLHQLLLQFISYVICVSFTFCVIFLAKEFWHKPLTRWTRLRSYGSLLSVNYARILFNSFIVKNISFQKRLLLIENILSNYSVVRITGGLSPEVHGPVNILLTKSLKIKCIFLFVERWLVCGQRTHREIP